MSGVFFRVGGHDLGVDPAGTTATLRADGVLDAEITALRIPADAAEWGLHPPLLYLRGVRLPLRDPVALTIDDDLLDEHEIGLYFLEHADVLGELRIHDGTLAVHGVASSSLLPPWTLDVLVRIGE